MTNIEKITSLGFTDETFKAAVYDYIALFNRFNINDFLKWLTE